MIDRKLIAIINIQKRESHGGDLHCFNFSEYIILYFSGVFSAAQCDVCTFTSVKYLRRIWDRWQTQKSDLGVVGQELWVHAWSGHYDILRDILYILESSLRLFLPLWWGNWSLGVKSAQRSLKRCPQQQASSPVGEAKAERMLPPADQSENCSFDHSEVSQTMTEQIS